MKSKILSIGLVAIALAACSSREATDGATNEEQITQSNEAIVDDALVANAAMQARLSGTSDACANFARQGIAGWKAAGASDADIERLVQNRLAWCSASDVSPCLASIVGGANVDYNRLARMLFSDAISPGAYLAKVRDRTRKVHLRQVAGATGATCPPDDDGDLIPNDRDKCPGTGDLVPTDDNGCPSATEVPAPSRDDFRKYLHSVNVAVDPKCNGAPIPDHVKPLIAGEICAAGDLEFDIAKVANQPAGCSVYYEIDYRIGTSANRLLFAATESKSSSSTVGFYRALSADKNAGRAAAAYAYQHGSGIEWRVRAVNGNGSTSAWSDWTSGLLMCLAGR